MAEEKKPSRKTQAEAKPKTKPKGSTTAKKSPSTKTTQSKAAAKTSKKTAAKQTQPPVQEEPSLLDVLTSRIFFWRGEKVAIPDSIKEPEPKTVIKTAKPAPTQAKAAPRATKAQPEPEPEPEPEMPGKFVPVLMILGTTAFFLLAQISFEHRGTGTGVFFLLLGLVPMLWAVYRGELSLAQPEDQQVQPDDRYIRLLPLLIGVGLSAVAFVAFRGNQFNFMNVTLWVLGLGFILAAFWQRGEDGRSLVRKLFDYIRQPAWNINITRFTVLFLLAFGVAIFFRASQLEQVVPEMVSDHAEKLIDVFEVLQGQTRIYFPRNTGREAFQFYLIAATVKLFNTGVSFLSMKIGTVFMGLFMLPYMYLLGKEVGNRWTGFLAMFLAGIAYWPNVLARVALRFILYPAFVAPMLYYLLRGLRTSKRNDFIWAGIFLGIGLHGYTPFRIMPVLVVLAVVLFLVHKQSKGVRRDTILWLSVLAFVSLIIFLPLARYWLEYPEVFGYRAFSRMGGVERNLPGSAWSIFFMNLWVALKMVNINNGGIWVVSIPGRPALDVVSAAFFLIGAAMLAARYLQKRHWQDLFLLLAYPALMLPSILSLAFPDENPAANRAGGAVVAVFLIAALGLEAILRGLRRQAGSRVGPWLSGIAGIALVALAAGLNYNLTFDTFKTQYTNGAWNTSEMGGVIANFVETAGTKDSAWVVAYPHWVDNRLVGINAGFPDKNYAIWPDEIVNTLEVPGPKLFLYRPDDVDAIAVLRELYPNGANALHVSALENKDFYTYFVPADE